MGLPDARIPDDKLPQCWADDVRMNALFAPFRLKSANPESWEMKMKFWSDMVRQWCRCKQDPVVSAAAARAAFARKGRQPACLEVVIDEMYRNGELSPVNKYQQILYSNPEGWIKWGAKLAIRPAVFAVTAVGYLMPKRQLVDNDGLPKASIDPTQRFVVEEVVKEQALNLLNTYPVGEERVGSVDHLMGICSVEAAGREGFETLLGWLLRNGLAAKQEEVVKLAESASSPAGAVSPADAARARLASAERRLAAAAERAGGEAAAAAAAARASVHTGDRLAAKSHLRRRLKAEGRARRHEAALDNVRRTLLAMRDMEDGAAVVGTYRMSTQAMKQSMRESGLSEDAVLDTMDDLRDALEACADVERALSPPTAGDADADLDAELDALLASDNSARPPSTPTRLPPQLPSQPPSQLPSPPAGSPGGFVYDGEARMLAELRELGTDDGAGERRGGASGTADGARRARGRDGEGVGDAALAPGAPAAARWRTRDADVDALCRGFAELRTDQRLHPGQKLDIDHASPTKLYSTDFQVQDHRLTDGVWVFNSSDSSDPTARPATRPATRPADRQDDDSDDYRLWS